MKNNSNKRLLSLLLTGAMLMQPLSAVAVSAPDDMSLVDSQGITAEIEAADEAQDEGEETGQDVTTGGQDTEQDAVPAEEQSVADTEEETDMQPESEVLQPETEEKTVEVHDEATVVLQGGTAVIPAGSNTDTVKMRLAEALISNCADFTETELLALEWEYYCEGKTKIGTWGNKSWGSIEGFTTETGKLIKTTYAHPALADNGDNNYQVRLKSTETEVTFSKKSALDASILLKENATVSLPYKEDASVDYAQLQENVFHAMVAATTPELTASDVSITYYAEAKSGSVGGIGKNWAPLSGGKVSGLEYPAISAGSHQIRFAWNGDGSYGAVQVEGSITIADREAAPYTQKDPVDSVKLPVNADLTIDYDALAVSIFHAVIAESDVLTADNVTLEYYATAKTGNVGGIGKSWVPLSGGKESGLEYPGIPAGIQKIRISWPGNRLYASTTVEADVEILDREQVQFILNDGPYEAGMVFTPEQGYDYAATAKAIYDAVVASASPEVGYESIKVEYNTDRTGLTHISYKSLEETDATGLVKFKDGKWEIRISCGDTVEYRGNSVTAEVTVSDNRLESIVVLNEGVSFTYNMDASVMEQAVFDSVVDWNNSTLPAKETLSLSDFEIKYKAQIDILDGSLEDISGSLNDSTKRWMPVEGGKYLGVPYAPMGAGEHQVQISYKGNAEYRPSDATEGSIKVNKANVKVRVHSTNIYADQAVPDGFITTDPADKFDFYTIYAGATSNVNLGLYLDLPDKFDNNKLIGLIDPVVEKIAGRSFSKMMQEGVTLGELRSMFDSTELLELLDKIGVDTGAFGQILKVLNALPAVTDSVRIGFGVPNRAGLYSVTVITDNKNYNTGVGMGTLLVRMRLSGVKLTWSQSLGSKISVADAKDFDFKAVLSYNGDVTVSQNNVHYLYSGFTSKWRVYSSTTTPPSEPGRYVMTVVTLGGNYQALPITRSFQITK